MMKRDVAMPAMAQAGAAVPRLDWLMVLFLLLLIAGVGAGIYAQFVGHHHAFATTREVPWGMLIGVYAYLAIISTGLCLMAAISHVFHVRSLQPLANRMIYLSIVVLLGAFTVIGLEIENPWRMPLNMIMHPNLTSNIWWMGTLYGLALSLLMLEFCLIALRRWTAALIFGLIGAVAEMLANTNLGSVFASLSARPFWYGSQLPIFFLASALLSGAAAVIVFTHGAHALKKRQIDPDRLRGLQASGRIMALMILLILLATSWKFANAYCGTEELRMSADALLFGPLATNFWLFELSIGLLLPLLLLVVDRTRSLQALSLAALMVLVGQFFSRYNLVVAGLIVPEDIGMGGDVSLYHYIPSIAEYLLAAGGFGLIGCGFLLGERKFGPIFQPEAGREE